jgi:hypothetical protein
MIDSVGPNVSSHAAHRVIDVDEHGRLDETFRVRVSRPSPPPGTFSGSSLFPLTLVYVHIGDTLWPMWRDGYGDERLLNGLGDCSRRRLEARMAVALIAAHSSSDVRLR